jgi:ligand-binding SRPBCC domain-containing protein
VATFSNDHAGLGRDAARRGDRSSPTHSWISVALAWIHEHRFEERDGGTLMHDHVRYAVLFDFLIHRFFIRPDIERIFAYREKKLREIFA